MKKQRIKGLNHIERMEARLKIRQPIVDKQVMKLGRKLEINPLLSTEPYVGRSYRITCTLCPFRAVSDGALESHVRWTHREREPEQTNTNP